MEQIAGPRNVGTGFVIDGKRILTNAHVVSYPSQIYVQPYQSSEKFLAKVIAVSSTIDLAVLSIEDETFFNDRPALVLDEGLPRVKAPVNVYGFPVGGDQMSVTEGISSRSNNQLLFRRGRIAHSDRCRAQSR